MISTDDLWQIDDNVPTADEIEEAGIDIDEQMRSYVDQFAGRMVDLSLHDTDGYLAYPAGSSECVALGHREPAEGWDEDDDLHPVGWDGGPLCIETRHGLACSWCEGECHEITLPDLWSLPWVRND